MKKVSLVFKTHLDLGFTDLAANVRECYLESFIPKALALAEQLRELGGAERFVWTTGSWLIFEALAHYRGKRLHQLEQAILRGDIRWHALPFTTHSELAGRWLFSHGLELSRSLDQRFGVVTRAAKMTDVPGHTRGVVPILADAGVRFLHLGVNPASALPRVPPAFRWQAANGSAIVVFYSGVYGSGGQKSTPVPGHFLRFAHTGDNHGPPDLAQILDGYAALRREFPDAKIEAASLEPFGAEIWKHRQSLPQITDEIGDSWIHGVGTDPAKVARFRECCRWLQNEEQRNPGRDFFKAKTALLLVAEHTWGLDVKSNLANWKSYDAGATKSLRQKPEGKRMEASWREQREYIDQAIRSLPRETSRKLETHLELLTPRKRFSGRRNPSHSKPWSFGNHLLEFSGGSWSWSFENTVQIAKFQLFHQRFDAGDYERFWKEYNRNKDSARVSWWAVPDFTRPELEISLRRREWSPKFEIQRVRETGNFLHLRLHALQPESGAPGCPKVWTTDILLHAQEPRIEIEVQWFEKTAVREPEAMWAEILVPDHNRKSGAWKFTKLQEPMDFSSVVDKGGMMLAAMDGVAARGPLSIESLDAPLISASRNALLRFRKVRESNGLAINLFNNVWGTNFPQWYDKEAKFRFMASCQFCYEVLV